MSITKTFGVAGICIALTGAAVSFETTSQPRLNEALDVVRNCDSTPCTSAGLREAFMVLARPTALEDLLTEKEVKARHIEQRQRHRGKVPETIHNFAGADLRFAYLVNAQLKNIDFTGANLYMADLRFARLSSVNLTGSNTLWTNFVGTKFCKTMMPDGSMCTRDCPESITSEAMCPFLEQK